MIVVLHIVQWSWNVCNRLVVAGRSVHSTRQLRSPKVVIVKVGGIPDTFQGLSHWSLNKITAAIHVTAFVLCLLQHTRLRFVGSNYHLWLIYHTMKRRQMDLPKENRLQTRTLGTRQNLDVEELTCFGILSWWWWSRSIPIGGWGNNGGSAWRRKGCRGNVACFKVLTSRFFFLFHTGEVGFEVSSSGQFWSFARCFVPRRDCFWAFLFALCWPTIRHQSVTNIAGLQVDLVYVWDLNILEISLVLVGLASADSHVHAAYVILQLR